MDSKQPIPYRPLGIIKTLLDSLGFQVTHCYEDLIFIEHNAFLLRMEEKGEEVSLFFNTDSNKEKRIEISEILTTKGSSLGLDISSKGTYTMTQNEENATIDISFNE